MAWNSRPIAFPTNSPPPTASSPASLTSRCTASRPARCIATERIKLPASSLTPAAANPVPRSPTPPAPAPTGGHQADYTRLRHRRAKRPRTPACRMACSVAAGKIFSESLSRRGIFFVIVFEGSNCAHGRKAGLGAGGAPRMGGAWPPGARWAAFGWSKANNKDTKTRRKISMRQRLTPLGALALGLQPHPHSAGAPHSSSAVSSFFTLPSPERAGPEAGAPACWHPSRCWR